MQIKDFLGTTVLDKNADVVGKIDNVSFDVETGKIDVITLNLQKNIFSSDELEIAFEDIQTIGTYVILNKDIPKEEAETVEIEIDDD